MQLYDSVALTYRLKRGSVCFRRNKGATDGIIQNNWSGIMKTIKPILITSLLFLFVFCLEVRAQTQAEMNQEASLDFKQQDAELNKVYKEILTVYKEDTLFIKTLKTAQRAWVLFRDAHVNSLFPDKDGADFGTSGRMCYSQALAEITKKRVAELKVWLEGIEEGDVCAGSVKTKGELEALKKR
jgi:uncharacterized protein YecT (DUF1311 family)